MSLWDKIFGLQKNPEYERGIAYFNQGEYELAVAELEKAIPKAGHNDPLYALGMFYAAESHAHIGMAKYLAGDLEGALVHFKRAVEENSTYPDIYYRMGVIRHRQGALDEAISLLRSAIALNVNYFEATCYLGILLHEKGEREEAERVFKRAIEIGSESPSPISKFLSEHLAGRETDIPPLSQLRELVRTDSEFDASLREGIEAFNTGNYDQAIDAFRIAAGMHPEYADVNFKLALAYLKRGDHGDAREWLKAALTINPAYIEARFYLGVSYLDERLYREALAEFEHAAAAKPEFADLQCFLGATYFFLGELAKARTALEAAIKLSPQYCKAQYYYGLLLYAQGERAEGIGYLGDAVKGEEKRSEIDISFALAHLREGNLEEAMAILKDIAAAGGESADVLYFIGECYLRMGKDGEAAVFLEKALAANPLFLRAKEKLALIKIRRGAYEEAERVIGSPGQDFADLYKILGDIKFLRGDLDAAETYYRKGLALNAEYSEASLSLALTLRKKGSDAEADAVLARLLEHDPENVVARSLVGRGPLDLGSR